MLWVSMSAYLDCFACACLIRAGEPSCPFCGASQRLVSAPASRTGLGLVLGLGLAVFGCGDKEGDSAGDTVGDSVNDSVNDSVDVDDGPDTQEADAVTYAGPDPWTDTIEPGTTFIPDDSDEADAVTYAGPDETTTIGDATTTSGTATDTTSGTTTDSDSQEADAVTYAGPDETSSTGTG
jgi:hypothetical protein